MKGKMKVVHIDWDDCPYCADSLFAKSTAKQKEGEPPFFYSDDEVFCCNCNFTSSINIEENGAQVADVDECCNFCGQVDLKEDFNKVESNVICHKCNEKKYKHKKTGKIYVKFGYTYIKEKSSTVQGISYGDEHLQRYVRETDYFNDSFERFPILADA